MTLEGNLTGGGELQVDGAVKGDVRVEHVTIGDGGQVDGGVFAEAVEVRGKVTGSITAKQVRLHGACRVEGDISHEQLAMEIGAYFQGRSLRLQRPPFPGAPQRARQGPRRPRPGLAAPRDRPSTSLRRRPAPGAPKESAGGLDLGRERLRGGAAEGRKIHCENPATTERGACHPRPVRRIGMLHPDITSGSANSYRPPSSRVTPTRWAKRRP